MVWSRVSAVRSSRSPCTGPVVRLDAGIISWPISGCLGKKAKVDGKVVDAVDIYVGGRSGPDPKLAVKIMEDVPCDRLPMVLEGLVPYHSREKMHRVRGGGAKKLALSKETPNTTAA